MSVTMNRQLDKAAFAQRLSQVRLIAFDFDGVFTDNTVLVDDEGHESVRCWRGDGLGLSRLRRAGWEMLVVSTEKNPVVSRRCEKLKLSCHQAIEDKVVALEALLAERGLDWSALLFMGNDINDAGALERAGLAVVVADAHPAVLPLAHWVTDASGGRGAVRELCERIMDFQEAAS